MNIYFTKAATFDLETINSYLSQNWGHNSRLKFEDWLKSKRYSPNTQKTYLDSLKVFLQFMKVKPLDEIDSFDLI